MSGSELCEIAHMCTLFPCCRFASNAFKIGAVVCRVKATWPRLYAARMDTQTKSKLPVKPIVSPQCQRCGATPCIVQTILDSRNGRTVHLYECECGERIWDD
jgi:hypothetical protein